MASDGASRQDIGAETVRDADDLDRLRRRLANVIGHALRTPAATVRGQVDILARTSDEADRERTIELLRRSSRRLEEMIDEVLVVEDLDTRLPTGRIEDLDVATVAREVADDLEVVDELTVVGDTSARVRAGRDALGWLLRSLLDNAGRYGDGGVEVEIARDDTSVRLAITSPRGDIGLTPDDLRLGFEPFYRGERAVTVTATRLGVGLSIAQRLAESLGGRVRLEQDDEGTVTLLELPRP